MIYRKTIKIPIHYGTTKEKKEKGVEKRGI